MPILHAPRGRVAATRRTAPLSPDAATDDVRPAGWEAGRLLAVAMLGLKHGMDAEARVVFAGALLCPQESAVVRAAFAAQLTAEGNGEQARELLRDAVLLDDAFDAPTLISYGMAVAQGGGDWRPFMERAERTASDPEWRAMAAEVKQQFR